MWIFKFLPDWFFHAFGIVGILAILASMFLKRIPFVENYYLPIRIVGFVTLCFGIFFEGALYNNAEWVARVKEMEAKVATAEAESKKENIKIVEKIVVYYESIKRELKIKPIYECRCAGRLQTKRFTRVWNNQ